MGPRRWLNAVQVGVQGGSQRDAAAGIAVVVLIQVRAQRGLCLLNFRHTLCSLAMFSLNRQIKRQFPSWHQSSNLQ